MELFDVYSLFDVTPVRAKGTRIWDDKGVEYLDLYGGHAVISVGHCHPKYVAAVSDQLGKIGFYSNSIHNPLQEELARKIGELSGYPEYSQPPLSGPAAPDMYEARNSALISRSSFFPLM